MEATQNLISAQVRDFLGMTEEQAVGNPRAAERRAAAILRANGYVLRYSRKAWKLGWRWYYEESRVPEPDLSATSLLDLALTNEWIA